MLQFQRHSDLAKRSFAGASAGSLGSIIFIYGGLVNDQSIDDFVKLPRNSFEEDETGKPLPQIYYQDITDESSRWYEQNLFKGTIQAAKNAKNSSGDLGLLPAAVARRAFATACHVFGREKVDNDNNTLGDITEMYSIFVGGCTPGGKTFSSSVSMLAVQMRQAKDGGKEQQVPIWAKNLDTTIQPVIEENGVSVSEIVKIAERRAAAACTDRATGRSFCVGGREKISTSKTQTEEAFIHFDVINQSIHVTRVMLSNVDMQGTSPGVLCCRMGHAAAFVPSADDAQRILLIGGFMPIPYGKETFIGDKNVVAELVQKTEGGRWRYQTVKLNDEVYKALSRKYFASCEIKHNGKRLMLIHGGIDAKDQILDNFIVLDLENLVLVPLPSKETSIGGACMHSMLVKGTKLFVIGGKRGEKRISTSSTDVLDLKVLFGEQLEAEQEWTPASIDARASSSQTPSQTDKSRIDSASKKSSGAAPATSSEKDKKKKKRKRENDASTISNSIQADTTSPRKPSDLSVHAATSSNSVAKRAPSVSGDEAPAPAAKRTRQSASEIAPELFLPPAPATRAKINPVSPTSATTYVSRDDFDRILEENRNLHTQMELLKSRLTKLEQTSQPDSTAIVDRAIRFFDCQERIYKEQLETLRAELESVRGQKQK